MTVWYDFTTTIRNRGRSGIASVEWNVGQNLLATDPTVRCFESHQRFGLVELAPDTRLADAVYASPDTGAAAINMIPTWRDDVRATLMVRWGVWAPPAIQAMSWVYQIPNRVRRIRFTKWIPSRPLERPKRLLGEVQRGDVVVSLGADWDGQLARRLMNLKRHTGCHVVTMVYDLVPLTHTHLAFHNDPDLFVRYYRALLEVSDLITCISEQTRRDLVDFAGEQRRPVPRSEVLALGETAPATADEQVSQREDFYLCVGTIERRKNLELIYDALRILESEGRVVPRVVVAGAIGWGTEDFVAELQQQSTRASRAMVLVGSVDDAALDRLYRSAKALLFPSHFEGWGLPVREAAIRGCPVAAGDSPAVREAAAGYAGATLLPTDDPGPWADYMVSRLASVEPAAPRPWSAVAEDLIRLLPAAG